MTLPDQPPLDLAQSITPAQPGPDSQPISHAPLPVTIRWQARHWMADPLIISLKLLDKDFNIGGERIATLGDRYPNLLWIPSEIVEESYPVNLKPDAPPGLYQLELSLIQQDKTLPDGFAYLPLVQAENDLGPNLYPATFRLLDPAHHSPPAQPLSAQLGEAIQLTGYDLTPGNPLALALYWQSSAKIPTDYTVFSQLIGPDGQVWAQWDNPPQAGRYPTTAWRTPDTVVDRYTLTLRDGAPPGLYRLLTGMYDPTSGQRLPVTINGESQPDGAVEVTQVRLGE